MTYFKRILAICLSMSLVSPMVASADTNTASWLKWKNTKLSAHRGAQVVAPENSLAGVQGAKELGYAFIEIDVRKTADNQYVLMHDKTIDRTTTGYGSVASQKLKPLRVYHLVDKNNRLTTEQIPTLKDVLASAKKYNVGVNIDGSKGDFGDQKYAKGIVTLVKKANMYNKTFFVISDSKARAKFNKNYPNATISFIGNPKKSVASDIKKLKKYKHAIYTTHINNLDAATAKKIRASGLRIHIYGVNTKSAYKRAKSYKPLLVETDKLKP